MADPAAVFRAAGEAKRMTLQAVWPDLYDALAGRPGEGEPAAPIPCSMLVHMDRPLAQRPAVVARLTPNGYPACTECVASMAERPGGFPLPLVDPRTGKEV